jgi:hypothetical protein
MTKRKLESDTRMRYLLGNNPLGELVKIIKEIWLGFKIAEGNRDKSQWGKF